MNIKNSFLRTLVIVVLTGMFVTPVQAYFAPSNGQAAKLVLGQANFSTSTARTTQRGLNYPTDVTVDPTSHKVFVADGYNNRVLRYPSIYALTSGAAAEVVLGQTNFNTHAAAHTRNGMNYPRSVFVDKAGHLWVADAYNNRVLRFDHASTIGSGAGASIVLGQANFNSHGFATTRTGMYGPRSAFVDAGGRLWVGDALNNRVLRFNNAAAKTNGAKADGVLGQADFFHRTAATTQRGMNWVENVVVDAGGHLWVVDSYNNRVLRFDHAAAKPNGGSADGVLGQPSFTTHTPATTQNRIYDSNGLTVDNLNGRLYVAEDYNNRILVFNSAASLPNGANASYVLGQKNFNIGAPNTGGLSASTLYYPYSMFFDPTAKVLLATDARNNRVLMYGKPSK